MGMLTNRTQRHDSAEVSTPPSIAPAAPPAPATALQTPRARARRSPEKVVMMIVRVAGDRKAPATPCTGQRWSAMLAQLNVNPGQYGVLMALGEAGRLGQHRLAELIGVDPRNAVPIVDALAEQGLVIRQVDPSDRRRRMLELTASGRAVAGNLASVAAEIETDLLRPLAPGEQAALRRMLLALLDAAREPDPEANEVDSN